MRATRLIAQATAVGAVAVLLGLLVWKVTHGPSKVAAEVDAGKVVTAPGFGLSRLDAPGRLELASLRGKVVLVNSWAPWCAPCKEEIPLLERTWQKYRSQGLVVVGIDAQDFSGDAKRFARKLGITYPIVHDGPGKTVDSYGVTGFPETFFIGRDGKLVAGHFAGAINANDTIAQRFDASVRAALRS
ncbi:MAG: TlpA family protein disulfide reductase [Gaiellaceae bacterium]